MTTTELEKRISAIEQRLESLDKRLQQQPAEPYTNKRWLKEIWGSFAGDPAFLEAMRYGREWRERENRKSLRQTKRTSGKKRR